MSEIFTQPPPTQVEVDTETVRQAYLDNLKFLKEALSEDLSQDRLDLFKNYPPVKAKPKNLSSLRGGIELVSAALNSQSFNPDPDKFRTSLIETLKANKEPRLLAGVNLALEALNMVPIQEDALAETENNSMVLAA